MSVVANPALKAFVAQVRDELIVAQVLIARAGNAFELRHLKDRETAAEALRTVALSELRDLAQFTASGAFRPLKSAPNLRPGWRIVLTNEADLQQAMDRLYPGAIADWFAAQLSNPPVTHYREFTDRQTGMYRITAMLNDTQAAQVIRACCQKKFCAKRRRWTVAGLPTDEATEKSLIPCLEPCAVMLELARTAMRIERQNKIEIAPDDAATIVSVLQAALARPDPAVRDADFNAANNPRRIQLVLEKLAAKLASDPES